KWKISDARTLRFTRKKSKIFI
ncbi:unnamed protein product, partial [Callosobruchus maculatus]